ncbi:MAG: imidazoleglycerol-phosphate dehydratase HisB [Candidatus Pelethousia sp.]|nr:imidazoleglycerol-phosphate dehydratase HisB [Candidatus Pelethousia sp.]
MRQASVTRKTAETDIHVCLHLDGAQIAIDTGCGFLDHMLTLFAAHGRLGLSLSCTGDTEVDYHHTTEDIGIALGQAFAQALGDKRGICRYGSFLLPMDEALVLVALDISGRASLAYSLSIPTEKVGDFDTELVREFLLGLCRSMGLTLHVRQLAGLNSHHIIEAAFKGLGRAMQQAVAIDEKNAGAIPSTKGMLE